MKPLRWIRELMPGLFAVGALLVASCGSGDDTKRVDSQSGGASGAVSNDATPGSGGAAASTGSGGAAGSTSGTGGAGGATTGTGGVDASVTGGAGGGMDAGATPTPDSGLADATLDAQDLDAGSAQPDALEGAAPDAVADAQPPSFEVDCTDGDDEDDDGVTDCADPDCDGALCRASAGGCDAAEVCSGGACPVDVLENSGTVCRAAAGICDAEETCDGVSADCPDDLRLTTVCNASTGDCDPAEVCDGVSPDCPQDVLAEAGVVCRATSGPCDAEDLCDGVSATCADGLQPAGTVCRPAAGVCDVEETCDGASPSCPTDAFMSSTPICRSPIGACDAPERCPGDGPDCRPDAWRGAGTPCRFSAGACDTNIEVCAGGTPYCPPDTGACSAGQYCAGDTCVTLVGLGASCTADAQCDTGMCYDGVCCDSVCDGPCRTCDLPGSVGSCTNWGAGLDPEDGCGLYACDGSGACEVSCGGGQCSGACDPFSAFCDGSACAPRKVDGASCTQGCECESLSCVDGVCCDTACDGDCEWCARPGSVGTCTPHVDGKDPEGDCGNYVCDGSGACYASCPPASPGAPRDPCASQCDSGAYCAASGCSPREPNGMSCVEDCECASGFCRDGVCCDTDCSGDCRSCDFAPGTCTNAFPFTDPDGDCDRYLCDGAGSCFTSCTGQCGMQCRSDSWCSFGVCAPDLLPSLHCSDGCQCLSGVCLFPHPAFPAFPVPGCL